MPEAIRVLIADDHPVVRQGLRAFLASCEGLELVGEASDAHGVVVQYRALRPDVALVDLVMPGGGVEAIRGIREHDEGAKILVLTSFVSDDQVVAAVEAGATGYLLKDADPGELERAIRTVHRGEGLLHPQAASKVMARVAHPAPASTALRRLTAREHEVLALLAEGLSNREVARRLGIAEKTVKTHVSNLLRKLGVADRTQAALLAVREGIRPES